MVENIRLLFQDVTTVNIDRFGSQRNWIHEASNEECWNQLVARLLNPHTLLPECPEAWGPLPSWRARRNTSNQRLIMKATTTMMKMEMMTATITEMTVTTNRENANNPPHHHDKHPPRTSQGHIAPPLPPNTNQNDS